MNFENWNEAQLDQATLNHTHHGSILLPEGNEKC